MDKSRSQQAYSSLGKEPDQGYDKWCFTEDYTLEEDSEQLGCKWILFIIKIRYTLINLLRFSMKKSSH